MFVEYFEGTNFDNLVRDGVESTVDFDFGRSSPDGLPQDNFSIRFTGQVEALFSEEYTFETTSDDGIRLFVNDQLIIDNFTPHSATVDTGTIVLEAGQRYDIRLEYFERTGNSIVQLAWNSASQAREIIPQSQLYSSNTVSEPPADDPTSDPVNDAPVTYYVSVDGFDGFSLEQAQDPSTPWRSIGRAVFSARAGDTVIVADGTYTEGVFLDNSGTADQEIILRAENRQGVRLEGFIHGRDVSYVTVDGFDVTNSNDGSISQGIVFYSSHHITVRNNLVRDSFGGGISFNQSDSILIEGNTVHGNAFFHPDAHSGISVYQPQRLDDSQAEYGVIIRNNISFGNANTVPNQNCCGGEEITDGNGIILDDYQNLQPSGNGVDYDRRTLVENNVVYENGGSGIHVFFSHLIDIRNNTAVNNVLGLDEGAQINVSDSRDVNIYNNIASIGFGQNAVRSITSSGIALQNNIVDGPDVGIANDPSNFYGVDPEFLPGTFELAAESVGVDQGLEVDDPFSIDAFGRDRVVGRIDIGASERQS